VTSSVFHILDGKLIIIERGLGSITMRGVEWWEVLFGSLSFLAAGLSAHQWFLASRIKLPSATGDDWEGRGPFANALARQSGINARAAYLASFAAVFQAFAMAAKVIGALIGAS
jgi:hypothetical protein